MKNRNLFVAIAVLLAIFALGSRHICKNYSLERGDRQIIGGTLEVVKDGILDVNSASVIKRNGNALNGLLKVDSSGHITAAVTDSSTVWNSTASTVSSGQGGWQTAAVNVLYNTSSLCANADLLQLQAHPKTLVSAYGANTIVEMLDAVIQLDYGSAVLTDTNDLRLQYSFGAAIVDVNDEGFLDQTVDTVAFAKPSAQDIAGANCVNKDVQLINTGTKEYGGGTGTVLHIFLTYKVREIP
jgi:hypothetical protein